MTVRLCIGCDKDIEPPASRCPDCLNAQRRARRHPGYDSPAYRKRRRNVRNRICQGCGMRAAATVHHRDGNPGNNADSNLQDLCDDCAQEADKLMRERRRTRNGR